ncbi:MAG: hypothetical protein H0X51_03020 [Parachlamydiaceae bacterium]|nr:hypothetical protein [Parachlamydiaceae bacterium]
MRMDMHKARVNIECSLEDRKAIKMMAAQHNMTISAFILELVHEKMEHCPISWGEHIPNDITVQALDESDRGEGVETFNSLGEMWKSMGIDDENFESHKTVQKRPKKI